MNNVIKYYKQILLLNLFECIACFAVTSRAYATFQHLHQFFKGGDAKRRRQKRT